MIIKLEILRTLSLYITLFLAYLIAITPSGFFRAWVAKKLGDNSAERAGLLSLNPFDHIDPIGLIFLFIFYFGWGKVAPLNIDRIRGKYFNIKLIAILFSSALMYILVMVAMLFFLGVLKNNPFSPLHFDVIGLFRSSASLQEAITGVLVTVTRLSTLLFIVNFVSGVITLMRIYLFDRYPEYMETIFWGTFILTFLIFIFFSGYINYLFNVIVLWIHLKIRALFGIY